MTFLKLYKAFDKYLTKYISINGCQSLSDVKRIAKQYAIESRGGNYDLTARNRYFYIFVNFCYRNDQELLDWDLIYTSHYDPDNEYADDPRIIKLKQREQKRLEKM